MDTSRKYIDMCRLATDIQNLWKPTGGDWYIHDYRGSTGTDLEFEKMIWGDKDETWQRAEILCYQPKDALEYWVSTDGKDSHVCSASDIVKEHCIWLPRQDQLQEALSDRITAMLETKAVQIGVAFLNFSAWLEEQYTADPFAGAPTSCFETGEQLWLAFVMQVQYGLIWDIDNGEWHKSM